MIITLFIFALFFIIFGIIAFFRKRKLIGGAFILMGLMAILLGIWVVYLYPHTWPF